MKWNFNYVLSHINRLFFCAIIFSFFITSACKQSEQMGTDVTTSVDQTPNDSARVKYITASIDDFLKEESRLSLNSINDDGKVGGRVRQKFHYEYFIDNHSLSRDSFIYTMSEVPLGHVTRDLRMAHEDSTKVQSSQMNSHDIIFTLRAYSEAYINQRTFEIEFAELHYTDIEVLFLSLSTERTGMMQTLLLDNETGKKITQYQDDDFDGSFYLGNGVDSLGNTQTIGATIVIDNQFAFKEFDVRDIKG